MIHNVEGTVNHASYQSVKGHALACLLYQLRTPLRTGRLGRLKCTCGLLKKKGLCRKHHTGLRLNPINPDKRPRLLGFAPKL